WGKAFLSSWGRIANPPSPVQIREGPLLPHSVSPARNGPHLLQFPAVAGGCSSITPRAPNPRAKPLSGLFSCAAVLRSRESPDGDTISRQGRREDANAARTPHPGQ